MNEFIEIKSGVTTYRVHYSQVYQNTATKQWYWKDSIVALSDEISKTLEEKYQVQPNFSDKLDEFISKNSPVR